MNRTEINNLCNIVLFLGILFLNFNLYLSMAQLGFLCTKDRFVISLKKMIE